MVYTFEKDERQGFTIASELYAFLKNKEMTDDEIQSLLDDATFYANKNTLLKKADDLAWYVNRAEIASLFISNFIKIKFGVQPIYWKNSQDEILPTQFVNLFMNA